MSRVVRFFRVYCLHQWDYVFALDFFVVSFVCRSELLPVLIKLGRIFCKKIFLEEAGLVTRKDQDFG